MTTYTAITNGQIDQDSPITQPLMTAMRDNPIAITEGATGAPRIVGLAAATLDEMPLLTVSAADTYDIGLASDTVVGDLISTTGFVVGYTIDIVRVTGSVRFSIDHRTSNGVSRVLIIKNGTLVTFWDTSSPTFITRTADISVVPGDEIVWEHARLTSGDVSYIANQTQTATDGYTTSPLLIKASDT